MLVITVDTPRMGKLDPAEYNKYASLAICINAMGCHMLDTCRLSNLDEQALVLA